MQYDCQFASHRHYRAFFAALASRTDQLQSPAPQRGIFAFGSENALRSLHQKTAQILVAALADSTLHIRIATLFLSGSQAQKGARLPAARKSFGAIQGQNIGGRDDRTHALGGLRSEERRVG